MTLDVMHQGDTLDSLLLDCGSFLAKLKPIKVLMEDGPEDFFPYNDTASNSKTLVPHQGGSVVSASNS